LADSGSSSAEVNNLLGQYITALRTAKDMGIVLPLPLQKDAAKLGVPVYKQLAGS